MYLVGERNTETLVLVSGRVVTFNQVLRGLLECVACLGGGGGCTLEKRCG